MAAAVPLVFNEALNVSYLFVEWLGLWLPMDPLVGFYVGSSTAQRISRKKKKHGEAIPIPIMEFLSRQGSLSNHCNQQKQQGVK